MSLKPGDREYDECVLELTAFDGKKPQSFLFATTSEKDFARWAKALSMCIPDKLFGVLFGCSCLRSAVILACVLS